MFFFRDSSSLPNSSTGRQPKRARMKSRRRTSSRRFCLLLPSPSRSKDHNTHNPRSNLQAIQQNHPDIAKIYAQNAIRKQNEKLSLLRLGSRIDAVASRVQTAVTMRQVTGSMAGVVKGMEGAMRSMDLEKVGLSFSPPPLSTPSLASSLYTCSSERSTIP